MKGQYVLDRTAAAAIQKAVSGMSPSGRKPAGEAGESSRPTVVERASFDYGSTSYSIVPQHSWVSGKDRYGTRYQTDLAVRDGNRPGLELIRYFQPGSTGDEVDTRFGEGWRLLVPFRAYPIGPANKAFNTKLVPAQWKIRNLLNGREEALTLDTTKFAQSGYRPADIEKSQFVGMFWTVGGDLRLADKFGNQFWFNGSGMLREMHFSDDFGLRLKYDMRDVPSSSEKEAHYRLAAEGKDVVTGFNVPLPRRLRLTTTATGKFEIFRFGEKNGSAVYRPEADGSHRIISLRRDGSHVLEDLAGVEYWFHLNREFMKKSVPLLTSMAQGRYQVNRARSDIEFVDRHRVHFEHEFVEDRFRVVAAKLFKQGESTPVHAVAYQYSDLRTLASVALDTRR